MTKIKKFTAPSIQEAFAMVTVEMGKDAVILGTTRRARADLDGNRVEVVAASGGGSPAPAPHSAGGASPAGERASGTSAAPEAAAAAAAARAALDDVARLRGADRDIMSELREIDARLKDIMETMAAPRPSASPSPARGRAGTDARLEEAGFDQGLLEGGLAVPRDVRESFERMFENLVSEVPIDEGDERISVFLGPAGSGKTTSVLKIAVGVLLPKRVKPLVVRFGDAGGKDAGWLRAQCKKLKLKFKTVPSAAKLERLLAKRRKGPVLVDTPSLSNLKDEDLRAVLEMSKRLDGMKLRLVVDAAMDPRNICAIASCIPDTSGLSLVLTKLDEATRIGGAVSAAIGRHMPVAYITGGSDVRDGIFVPDTGLLLEKVLEGIGSQKAQ